MISKSKKELIDLISELLREVALLDKDMQLLEKENRDLRDENDSLWLMLDETKESDILAKALMDEEKERYMIEILSTMKPVGDS